MKTYAITFQGNPRVFHVYEGELKETDRQLSMAHSAMSNVNKGANVRLSSQPAFQVEIEYPSIFGQYDQKVVCAFLQFFLWKVYKYYWENDCSRAERHVRDLGHRCQLYSSWLNLKTEYSTIAKGVLPELFSELIRTAPYDLDMDNMSNAQIGFHKPGNGSCKSMIQQVTALYLDLMKVYAQKGRFEGKSVIIAMMKTIFRTSHHTYLGISRLGHLNRVGVRLSLLKAQVVDTTLNCTLTENHIRPVSVRAANFY